MQITCRGDLAVSMCVHVGWSAVMPGFGLYFMLSILAVCCDIGQKIYQVSIRTMYLFCFMSKSGLE